MSISATSVRDSLEEVNVKGEFIRTDSAFRQFIKDDPAAKFPAESGRYHLYVSYACPWANRCLAVRALKGLEDAISFTTVHPVWQFTRPEVDQHAGWVFTEPNKVLKTVNGCGSFSFEDTEIDPVNGCKSIRELYELAGDTFQKYSVPVLWDKKTSTIVNNESSEIIEMLNTVFNRFAKDSELDLFPKDLLDEMKAADEWIYNNINNGVYRNGFAKSQEAYEIANESLFKSLDRLDDLLATKKYICGDVLTASDIRCFQTLIRFDEVYVVYFKCDRKKISEYKNIFRYCADLWLIDGIKNTTQMKHIKQHYYCSHASLNYLGIVPVGPNFIGALEAFNSDR